MRKLYDGDFKEFMRQLSAERSRKAGGRVSGGADEQEADMGTEAALALCERLLRECAEEDD